MEEYATISPETRNKDLQIAALERSRNPQAIAQQEAEDQQRKREVLRGSIVAFLEMIRSRLRSAGHPWPRASAHAEAILTGIDREMRSKFGDLKGEAALLSAAEYCQELEKKLVPLLEEVGALLADEQRQANIEARDRRETAWRNEAAKLNAIGVVRALEINGARLVLQDGSIGLKGGFVDERCRIYVNAHATEIKRLLVERETVTLVGEPERG